MQASVSPYSSVLFRPDNGDLIFNGVASRVDRDIFEWNHADASYKLNDQHAPRRIP
jgi:hypothetical protein